MSQNIEKIELSTLLCFNNSMNIYIVSDTHFGDNNINLYEHRPLPVHEMDERMVELWNTAVTCNDIVYHLGDFGLPSYAGRLNGRKYLIMGNHDRELSPEQWREAGFENASELPCILDKYIILQHEPPEYYRNDTPYCWLYGHVHSTDMYRTITRRTACMCAERWDYRPQLLSDIIAKMNTEE